MQNNRFKNFFENLNITYEDVPYLYIPLAAASILVFAAWFFWGEIALLWGIFVLTTYLILYAQFHLYRSTRKDLEDHQKKIQAYFSIYSMLDFKSNLPFMTGWAATPELALITLEEIKNRAPENILEMGSGISTIIASYGLKQNNKGTILSLDHDKKYAEKTTKQLRQHEVEDVAQVKYCPLVSYQIDGSIWQWYDLSSISLPDKIDMLLIDGPPVETNKMARYPALPLLTDHLSEQCTIVIHDAHRPSEREILEKWQKSFPEFNCDIENSEKGIAILRR